MSLESVTHFFERPTLENIFLDIRDGEFLSIVGPSGCGKTTLLNMMAGFLTPTSGSVRIRGDTVRSVQAGKIAYMFARDNLLPWRSALRNVELALEMGGKRPQPGRAQELLDLVGLGAFARYYPRQLSQGMRQRVAIARTLAVGVDIWLLDEPFGSLDVATRTVIHAEFNHIWEATRSTVVLVTHDLAEAIALSDRVVVMTASPGRIKRIYEIALPRPRRVSDMFADAAFSEHYRQLWADLKVDMIGPEGH
ncbi:MAG: ABC transporter ATP-binding protein [Tepidisphaerales bacterium]